MLPRPIDASTVKEAIIRRLGLSKVDVPTLATALFAYVPIMTRLGTPFAFENGKCDDRLSSIIMRLTGLPTSRPAYVSRANLYATTRGPSFADVVEETHGPALRVALGVDACADLTDALIDAGVRTSEGDGASSLEKDVVDRIAHESLVTVLYYALGFAAAGSRVRITPFMELSAYLTRAVPLAQMQSDPSTWLVLTA